MATYEMEQGNEYEEHELGEDLEDEASASTKIETIYGIPKQYFIIGVCVVAVIIMLLVIFALKKPKDSTSKLLTEPTEVVEEYQPDANELDWMNQPPLMDTTEISVSESTVSVPPPYAQEDRALLRSLGYTADEIEFAISEGLSVANLIDEAEADLDARNKESLQRVSDAASPEYQNMLNSTYLGQLPNPEPVDQTTAATPFYRSTTKTFNSDYVKCPTMGLQLWLKCKVDATTYVWVNVSPERYAKLPAKGNIVLTVEWFDYGENTYITKAYEAQSGLETVEGD